MRNALAVLAIVFFFGCSAVEADRHDSPRQVHEISRHRDNSTPHATQARRNAGQARVSYRVAADPDFKWNGHMASIWYPDLGECGEALVSANAIGDKITALKLQTTVKAEFKRKANWPTDKISDAGMTAMIYYSVTEDRPEPPRIAPIVIETVEEERVKVKVSEKSGSSMVSAGGWQAAFAEAGVEVEIVNRRTETRVEYPEYKVRGELKGWHVNIAIEAYYLTGEGRRKKVGAPAMTGMAYYHAEKAPGDERMAEVAGTLVQKMHSDGWNQSSKGRTDEEKLKVVYRTAADADYKWNGHMASILYPDYGECGNELSDLGAISDRIIAMNLQRAAQAQFKSNSNWPTKEPDEAGLIAMIYYTIEQDAPAPPRIVPVEVTITEEEKVTYKAHSSYESETVSHSGWQRMFSEAGVKVTAEKKKTTTEKREEVIYTCDEAQPRGFHVSVAIEVYYFKGEGKCRRVGKSALLGMAYWFSPKYPSDGKLSEVTTELVKRMGKEGRK
ncbi:MAG: hypothetical protein KF696_03655 [Planctomycetes bacterium]|nr:hypothetical protein [Planctomycetota bacterium]MCW8134065.1 hypothetical protein [Planctomycetota bacterium]